MANSLDQSLKGKVVVLSADKYKGTEDQRRFLCEDGFGCESFTNGTAIFGKFLYDGEKARVSGYDLDKSFEPQTSN